MPILLFAKIGYILHHIPGLVWNSGNDSTLKCYQDKTNGAIKND